MLDFSGAVESSVYYSMLENEPLAKSSLTVIRLPYNNRTSESLVAEATEKLLALTKASGFKIERAETDKTVKNYYFTENVGACKLIPEVIDCGFSVFEGEVFTIDKSLNEAYVGFRSFGGLVVLHSLVKQQPDDTYLYMPPSIGTGIRNSDLTPFVYHKGKVPKFIKGRKSSDGESIDDMQFSIHIKKSKDGNYYYEYLPQNHEYKFLKYNECTNFLCLDNQQ